ncbi:MAG: LuxR C-terminal-related transcriptional regulator [Gracilibacteraceae bacterium]|jgi:DNA-binding CsgD family transcriptional regulator/plasmid maintenance system antidote protein VapI|nr:LuxR C-terminal-related transcriptional regulator [Gracilibacteraceae bacterium]
MSENALSERIALILREQQLKNVDFAGVLGISANYVSLLVNGRKKMVSQPLARLIETTYGYRAEWVLTGKEPVRLDTLQGLQERTVEKIMRMDSDELRAVAAYIRALDDVRADRSASAAAPPSFPERLSALTNAERKVYDLFTRGRDARRTAEALGLSVNTIKTHLKRIFKKLGVASRKELLAAAAGGEKDGGGAVS